MALYISSGRRTRRTVVVAIVAAGLAFLAGWVFGRQQVPSVTSQVASAQSQAEEIAIGIERLDIEYEQAITSGGGDSVAAGVIAPLDELRGALQSAMDDAPWLAPADRADLLDSLASVRSAANAGVSLEEFQTAAQTAGSNVRQTFGIAVA